MYHFKTWVHVLVDHGGQVGFKNVTMYFHRKRELDFEAKFFHIYEDLYSFIQSGKFDNKGTRIVHLSWHVILFTCFRRTFTVYLKSI